MKTERVLVVTLVLLQLMFIVGVAADPSGPDTVSTVNSTTRNDAVGGPGGIIPAQAGNNTMLSIFDNSSTTVWQGYYGNVSSRILLANADNASVYEWTTANPSGEIYAANGTVVDWDTVRCVNLTNIGDDTVEFNENETKLEEFFNITGDQNDGIAETFLRNYTGPDILIGQTTISTSDHCPQTFAEADGSDFTNIMLTTDNRTIVFTAILEPLGAQGFADQQWHFQLMVAEDGKVATTTDYYFYIEIE